MTVKNKLCTATTNTNNKKNESPLPLLNAHKRTRSSNRLSMISTADTIFASQCTSHLKIKLIKNVFFVCLPAFIVFFFTLKKGEQRLGSGAQNRIGRKPET